MSIMQLINKPINVLYYITMFCMQNHNSETNIEQYLYYLN